MAEPICCTNQYCGICVLPDDTDCSAGQGWPNLVNDRYRSLSFAVMHKMENDLIFRHIKLITNGSIYMIYLPLKLAVIWQDLCFFISLMDGAGKLRQTAWRSVHMLWLVVSRWHHPSMHCMHTLTHTQRIRRHRRAGDTPSLFWASVIKLSLSLSHFNNLIFN